MERTMASSSGTSGSSSSSSSSSSSLQPRKVSGGSSGNDQRAMQAFFSMTAVFLLCLVYLLNPSSISADQYSSSRSSSFQPSFHSKPSVVSTEGQHSDQKVVQNRYSVLAAAKKPQATLTNEVQERSENGTLVDGADSLYHNFALFSQDYAEMEKKFKIFVYPEAYETGGDYPKVFLPHDHATQKNIGNYYSEHEFKIVLLNSKFVTSDPAEADLFFLPFSVNVLRNDMRVRSEPSIIKFVANYIGNVSREYDFWNRSQGADHFFVCCHSVGRDVPQANFALKSNAIQLVCSSNYYYKNYIPHKDVALPQVWPRKPLAAINPPALRNRLAFYAGRIQNSNIRQNLVKTYAGDPDLDFYAGGSNGSYEHHFAKSKFCVHVRGYEVNTARISDAIHFGCVPVIISDYYDLPLGDILDWSKFSIIVSYTRIPDLKNMLQGITDEQYDVLHENVLKVRKHFQWNETPEKFDAFHLSMYQLWLKRFVVRDSAP